MTLLLQSSQPSSAKPGRDTNPGHNLEMPRVDTKPHTYKRRPKNRARTSAKLGAVRTCACLRRGLSSCHLRSVSCLKVCLPRAGCASTNILLTEVLVRSVFQSCACDEYTSFLALRVTQACACGDHKLSRLESVSSMHLWCIHKLSRIQHISGMSFWRIRKQCSSLKSVSDICLCQNA